MLSALLSCNALLAPNIGALQRPSLGLASPPLPRRARAKCNVAPDATASTQTDQSIAIVGGGVSGIYAALTLVELGYNDAMKQALS